MDLVQVSQEFPEMGPGSPFAPIRNTPGIGAFTFPPSLEDVREALRAITRGSDEKEPARGEESIRTVSLLSSGPGGWEEKRKEEMCMFSGRSGREERQF